VDGVIEEGPGGFLAGVDDVPPEFRKEEKALIFASLVAGICTACRGRTVSQVFVCCLRQSSVRIRTRNFPCRSHRNVVRSTNKLFVVTRN